MTTENNDQKQQLDNPWVQYQEQQTKLWLNYWISVMNSLFNGYYKK